MNAARRLPHLGYLLCHLNDNRQLVISYTHLLHRQIWVVIPAQASYYRCSVQNKSQILRLLKMTDATTLATKPSFKTDQISGVFRLVDPADRAVPFDVDDQPLSELPMLPYEVDSAANGWLICIGKPGDKLVRGNHRRLDDFTVWVYDPSQRRLAIPTHVDIQTNIWIRAQKNSQHGTLFLRACLRI